MQGNYNVLRENKTEGCDLDQGLRKAFSRHQAGLPAGVGSTQAGASVRKSGKRPESWPTRVPAGKAVTGGRRVGPAYPAKNSILCTVGKVSKREMTESFPFQNHPDCSVQATGGAVRKHSNPVSQGEAGGGAEGGAEKSLGGRAVPEISKAKRGGTHHTQVLGNRRIGIILYVQYRIFSTCHPWHVSPRFSSFPLIRKILDTFTKMFRVVIAELIEL